MDLVNAMPLGISIQTFQEREGGLVFRHRLADYRERIPFNEKDMVKVIAFGFYLHLPDVLWNRSQFRGYIIIVEREQTHFLYRIID